MADRRITVAKNAGFCFGVARATKAVEREMAAAHLGERIFTLGRLIHNEDYNRRLQAGGVTVIGVEDLARLAAEATPDAPVKVFVRAHGMTEETEALLTRLAGENHSFSFVDCTCSFVKKIHSICAEHNEANRRAREAGGGDDRFLAVLGSPDHPEVVGFLSRFEGRKMVFGSAEEAEAMLKEAEDLTAGDMTPVLVAQTTQNIREWEKTKKIYNLNFSSPYIYDTICSITDSRQTEAAELARKCDHIVVIGGRDSSNSAKLYSICKSICADTVWVERADELPEICPPYQRIGIVAGASTPHDIIEEVTNKMSETMNENFAELLEESLKTLNTGDTVTGIITSISAGEIQLDLGAKVTGVIKQEQITDDPSAKLSEMFKIGDEVEAFVIRVSDRDGFAELSKKRVDSDKNWLGIVAAYEAGENLEGKVVSVNKGGVEAIVRDNRIFIPAAHTGIPREGDLSTLVGQTVTLRILEIGDRKRAKGSIRLVLRDQKRAQEKAFWDEIEEGKIYTGTVKSMTSYGAFVDLGGVDGMVHCSELSWKRIKSPAEVLAIGDEITVFVKSYDAEKKRISLGYKTEATNPWFIFTHQFAVGDTAPVKIVSLMPFGAFAEIIDGVDGLIHISQIADHKIGKPADVLEVGQVVDARIIDIDNENQKVSLSIRALLEEAKATEEAAPVETAEEAAPVETAEEAAPVEETAAEVVEVEAVEAPVEE
ncbi:MAG: 4-hydroxy-3-methylbut-2-enyl diphosphate reductase [Clostridia bacterium]|nr:4-hydroxy-3-methylbut-2-enyl diphosphate reductase [Clostridia bacterium]